MPDLSQIFPASRFRRSHQAYILTLPHKNIIILEDNSSIQQSILEEYVPMINIFSKTKTRRFLQDTVFKNYIDFNGHLFKKHRVHLEWWNEAPNLGDALSPLIFNWMLTRKRINPEQRMPTTHFFAVGSLLGIRPFGGVVWGSGILHERNALRLRQMSKFMPYRIYAVRGPMTRQTLLDAGYNCPEVYGDPAVLMPLIYLPSGIKKRYPVSVITHHTQPVGDKLNSFHQISIQTTDYKAFIQELLSSELVVSSSLHGIILAEAYGIPAVFWNCPHIRSQGFKFLDWYQSTGRQQPAMIQELSELGSVQLLPPPTLDDMRRALLDSFPYELWGKKS